MQYETYVSPDRESVRERGGEGEGEGEGEWALELDYV